MSVYTSVSREELGAFLTHYELGEVVDFQGIADGIENTNFFLTTTRGRFVLTLFEVVSAHDLPYFLDWMAFLADNGIPSAHPVRDLQGHYQRWLNGKPAAVVKRLEGRSVVRPTHAQCSIIGRCMAQMHALGSRFTEQRENDRGPLWWLSTAQRLIPKMEPSAATLLREELAYQARHASPELPRGVIHADLFRDNALFRDDTLTGVIDFYYACNDAMIYDLAVTVNDWCFPDSVFDCERARALVQSYQQIRPLTESEHKAWLIVLRAAALRFWLSRLQDKHFPRAGEITHIKDPDTFKQLLEFHIAHPVSPTSLLR
ncbi:MAG: homoserine kinase [Gammaproteobacteria bacterium]